MKKEIKLLQEVLSYVRDRLDYVYSKMNDVINIKIDNFGNIMGLMITVGMAIGSVLTLWGCVQFALAIQNDDRNNKMRASLLVASSILLLFTSTIIKAITEH